MILIFTKKDLNVSGLDKNISEICISDFKGYDSKISTLKNISFSDIVLYIEWPKFKILKNRYNGKYINFNSLNVKSELFKCLKEYFKIEDQKVNLNIERIFNNTKKSKGF